jgi:hypothetical protein
MFGATYGPGKFGQGFLLDGSDDYVLMPNSSTLFYTNGFTVELWYNNTRLPGGEPLFAKRIGGTAAYGATLSASSGIQVYYNDPTVVGGDFPQSGFEISAAPPPLPVTNTFHHFAASFEQTPTNAITVRTYIDGELIRTLTMPGQLSRLISNTPLVIGGEGEVGAKFKGIIDEVGLFDHVLSGSDIAAIYSGGSLGRCLTNSPPPPPPPPPPTNCPSSSLVSWWPAEGNASDIVGTNNGTMRNGATFAPGKVGQGFYLDGADDFVLVPDNPSLDFASGFSVQLWYRSDRPSSGEPLIDKRNGVSCNYGAIVSTIYGIEVFYNDPAVVDGDYPNGVEISAAPPPIPSGGVFHHFAATYAQVDSNHIQVATYIDGEIRRSRTMLGQLSRTVNSAALVFGSEAEGAGAKFKGIIDEVALFSRVLSPAEIHAIYQTPNAGMCSDGQPFLSSLPSQTVQRGDNAKFEIVAFGTGPFAYQWYFNQAPLADATNSVLTLSNVQFSQGGPYFVIVSGSFGSLTSSVATLTVEYPPTRIKLVSVESSAAGNVTMPVEINANGVENAVTFSLSFDKSILAFTGVEPGSGLPENSFILINTNSLGTGRVGISVALEPGTALPEGVAQLLLLHFDVATLQNPAVVSIQFVNDPVPRQVANKNAELVAAEFQSGTISITSVAFEADVAPRPGGDKVLNIIDWVQAGRFAVGLDTVAPEEFQRADSAPRATKGNGVISVADWVQAGRYSAGLDPITGVGGPTEPLAFAPAGAPAGPGCDIRISDNNVLPGGTLNVPVVISAAGIENALGFSLAFDSTKLRFIGATKLAALTSATLNLNTGQVSSGKLGLAFALSAGATLTSGTSSVVLLTFEANATASGTTTISFGDDPVIREAVTAGATTIPSTFTGGEIVVGSPTPVGPPLTIAGSVGSVVLFWPSTATGFELYSSDAPAGGVWTKVSATPIDIGGQKLVTVPTSSTQKFFRLEKR